MCSYITVAADNTSDEGSPTYTLLQLHVRMVNVIDDPHTSTHPQTQYGAKKQEDVTHNFLSVDSQFSFNWNSEEPFSFH